jgi:hypothetical protein
MTNCAHQPTFRFLSKASVNSLSSTVLFMAVVPNNQILLLEFTITFSFFFFPPNLPSYFLSFIVM